MVQHAAIRGWADVVTGGFDPRVLDNLTPTLDTRSASDIRFGAGGDSLRK